MGLWTRARERRVSWLAVLAVGIVGGASVALWYFGQKFARRFIALNGALPPMTWMFRRTTDGELEALRRRALLVLPFYLAAAVVYLAATGPLA